MDVKCSLILPYSRHSSSYKQESQEAAAEGERDPLRSGWMWPKAWEAFPLALNGTVLVFEAVKYLMFPLITCMWSNGIWREQWQQFSVGKDHIIFRGSLIGYFRVNKTAPDRLVLWHGGICTHFSIEMQDSNPHLISLACLLLSPFLCSFSELIAVLGPVHKTLYKGSVFVVLWGLGHLTKF